MLKSIQDPYKLVSRGISDVLKQIFQSCSFLFPFDTKVLYFKLVSFIGIDINRSLYFLENYIKVKGNKIGGQTLNPMIFGGDREKRQRIGHQKEKMDRKDMLKSGLQLIGKLQKRSLLEIEYHNEEGTGHGPTMEFYTSIAEALKTENDGYLWRTGVPNGALYPRAINNKEISAEEAKRICELFRLAGTMVAKSIVDDRLIDLPISSLMWQIMLGKVSLCSNH